MDNKLHGNRRGQANALDAVAANAEGGMSMGVYIKGMEMPTKCIICPLEMYGYCLANSKKNVGESVVDFVKDEDCPLIELPPHGRLIDADALMKDGWRLYRRRIDGHGGIYGDEMPLSCPSIPTVIEAEGK